MEPINRLKGWALVEEDVVATVALNVGRHLHRLECPNGHSFFFNSPSRTFASHDLPPRVPCDRCEQHWPVLPI